MLDSRRLRGGRAGGGIALGVGLVATGGLLATFWRPAPKKAPAAEQPAAQTAAEA